MWAMLLQRCLYGGFTLVFVACVVFWVIEMLPGDFCANYLGRSMTPTNLAQCRAELGLDTPVTTRFVSWWGQLLSGDFGTSLTSRAPVSDTLMPRLANTLLLGGIATVMAIPLAILLGLIAALKRDSWIDSSLSSLVLIAMTVPEFISATLLTLAFAIWLPWFPAITVAGANESLWNLLPGVWLPAITLALVAMAHMMRMTRSNTISVMDSDFMNMARIRQLPRWRLVIRHLAPAALLPTISLAAMTIAWLLGGVVIVEQVFNYPGLGRLMISAINDRDMPVVQACALVLSVTYVLCNLVADMLVIVLNPKLKTA